jgi:hypothetical protein
MLDRMLVVISNPTEGQEDEYNRWYDAVHIPEALTVPGFRAARRFRIDDDVQPGNTFGTRYLTVYDIDVDTATAAANFSTAQADGTMSPLSPAVSRESIIRPWLTAVTEWARAADSDPTD